MVVVSGGFGGAGGVGGGGAWGCGGGFGGPWGGWFLDPAGFLDSGLAVGDVNFICGGFGQCGADVPGGSRDHAMAYQVCGLGVVIDFWGSDLLSQSGVTFYGSGEGDGAGGDGSVVIGGDFAGGWAYSAWIWRD